MLIALDFPGDMPAFQGLFRGLTGSISGNTLTIFVFPDTLVFTK